MPYAVAHFLATAGIMKLFSFLRFDKGRFLSSRELFLCAFLGLLPDADFIVQFVCWNVFRMPFWPHRMFTHSIFVPIVLLVIGLLLYRPKANRYAARVFFLASAAWGVHVLLDLAFMGSVWLLAPISWAKFGFDVATNPAARNLFISVDAALLLGWLGLRFLRSKKG